jgi:dethiobiotin synthetase
VVLVEGAGGLLSPLGENFDSRELIIALDASPMVVCPNRLGAVNQALLALEGLPENFQARVRIVLVSPSRPDVSTKTNAGLLAGFVRAETIFTLPWLGRRFDEKILRNSHLRRTLRALMK